MTPQRLLLILLICTYPAIGGAQAIDNTVSYKDINADRYVRLNYENDFFSATDKYYTQGIHLEVVSPGIRRFLFSKLRLHPKNYNLRYGLGVEHAGYTNSNINTPFITYGDRPFAACLFLKTFAIATNADKKKRISTTLSTGVIGPAAGGAEMQTYIHKELHNITPHGWPNQIHNDAILNYQVNYEKQILSYGRYLSLDADGMARAGTLSDKASAGFTIQFGYFDSPYATDRASTSRFRMYAYDRPQVNIVGYDATLQGGVFNKTSPYTIPTADIDSVVLENRFGFVVAVKRIYLEYFQSLLGRELTSGNYHVWGGVEVAVGL